jgi:phosphoglycolate phosphatase
MNYKAVIFDLDGTLLDTLQDIARSMNSVLLQAGLPAHTIADYRGFIGYGFNTLVKHALPEQYRDAETVRQYESLLRREYCGLWPDNTRPHAGIPELLSALSCSNIKMAVLSNKPDDFTRVLVDSFLGRWHFDRVLGIGSGFPRKPDPAGALAIARHLSIRPAEIVFLGDSRNDMLTAVRAGMYPAGALWGFQTAEELTAGGAQILFRKPADVLPFRHAGIANLIKGTETIPGRF